MNLIFTCGGTAGHINPAIAVANAMREKYPDCTQRCRFELQEIPSRAGHGEP